MGARGDRRTSWAGLVMIAALAGACSKPPAAPAAEPPSLNVTSWTGTSELFMEYPPLVAGQTVRFAVHLTRLADFSALNAGRPRIEMTPEVGGSVTTLPGSEPLRPGAFRVEGRLPAAGRYAWTLVVDAPALADRHDLGIATVFPDQAAAVADAAKRPEGDPAAISYLKEQQWTNPFATAPVREADVRASMRVPAVIQPVTGGEAIVGAPAAGRFAADALISIGATVRQGQALGRIEPRLTAGDDRATLAAEVAEAQASAEATRAEQARAERLVADRAVPARRLEDARRAVTVAEARLRAAEARLAQRDETLRSGGGAAAGNAFVLRAPIAGRVAEVMATLGASYEEGAPLFKIVKTDEVELQALVPAADVARVRDVASVSLETPGSPDPLPLRLHHQHDSGVIDAETRALTVQFEVDNPGGRLLIGQSGTAVLFTKDTVRVPVVPKEAVLMEAGRPYVFVQTAGETFARRFAEIAAREGDVVGLKSGVKPGERVVVRGAYDVQLASAAKGLPAEGHVH
ncbi:MAG TPA: efflux RND transporter periplasmic adaptor subunit [Vicinamibacterales bacterium]|nr:efflux RND transporter periplasmic adaptor subunit [Vicinamibacterales bacterium]